MATIAGWASFGEKKIGRLTLEATSRAEPHSEGATPKSCLSKRPEIQLLLLGKKQE